MTKTILPPEPKTYNTQKPVLYKVLEASTGHISKKECTILTKNPDNSPVVSYTMPYGFLIYVPDKEDDPHILKYGFSKQFIALYELARKNKCKYLLLDADGVVYDDLIFHTW